MDVPEDLRPSRYMDLQAIGFKIGGMWVGKHEKNWINWLLTFQKYFVILFVFILPILGQTLYIAYDAKTEELIGSLNILMMEFFTAAQVCNFMYHRSSFIELLHHLESDLFRPSEAEHLDIIRVRIWWGRIVAKVFFVACPLSIVGFCLAPIFNGDRRIPTTIDYLVFDINKSPNYEIVYFFHTLYKPTICLIFVGILATPPALMSSAIAQLEIVIFNLENMPMLINRKQGSERTAEQVAADTMRNCVNRHKCIILYVQRLELIFGPQFFIQLINSSFVICTSGVAIMMASSGVIEFIHSAKLCVKTLGDQNAYFHMDCSFHQGDGF